MTDTELIAAMRQMITEELKPIKETLNQHSEKLDQIGEQLKEIDDAIGDFAEWADNVAIITKVPFASGGTEIK